jgi:hypothetical protein
VADTGVRAPDNREIVDDSKDQVKTTATLPVAVLSSLSFVFGLKNGAHIIDGITGGPDTAVRVVVAEEILPLPS